MLFDVLLCTNRHGLFVQLGSERVCFILLVDSLLSSSESSMTRNSTQKGRCIDCRSPYKPPHPVYKFSSNFDDDVWISKYSLYGIPLKNQNLPLLKCRFLRNRRFCEILFFLIIPLSPVKEGKSTWKGNSIYTGHSRCFSSHPHKIKEDGVCLNI